MSIQTENYVTEELVAGNVVSAVKTASATTYYRGQLLGRTDSTGIYGPFNAAGANGLEKIRAVCIKDTVLGAQGALMVYITGSEVQASGLKATNGTALTVTSAIIELAQDAGVVIK